MGVGMVFCMSATMAANNFSAAIFDLTGSYPPAWMTFTALMLITLRPADRLRRRATAPGPVLLCRLGAIWSAARQRRSGSDLAYGVEIHSAAGAAHSTSLTARLAAHGKVGHYPAPTSG